MRSTFGRHVCAYVALFGAQVGCGGDEEKKPATGAEGGACYANKTCDGALVCLSDKCVDPTSGDDVSPNPGVTLDLEACYGCGETKCATQAEACDALDGCGTLLSCTLECVNDAACSSGCATAASYTAEDQTAYVNYQTCLVTACLNECTPEVNVPVVPTATGTTGGGVSPVATSAPSSTGETNGAAACGVVKPSTNCVEAKAFVLEEQGTELIGVTNPTYSELIVDAASVKGDFVLETGQLGVLQFTFSQSLEPGRVAIEGNLGSVGYVTLEDAEGSGCQYELSAGRLRRYNKVNVTTGAVEWYGCWGDYETYDVDDPTGLSVVNIRTRASQLNEAYSITVTEFLL
jgi:hypothetical protein